MLVTGFYSILIHFNQAYLDELSLLILLGLLFMLILNMKDCVNVLTSSLYITTQLLLSTFSFKYIKIMFYFRHYVQCLSLQFKVGFFKLQFGTPEDGHNCF